VGTVRRRPTLGAQPQAGAELKRARGANEYDLRPPTCGQAGRDEIGAFNEEGAFTLTELALTQRRSPLDEGVLRAAKWFA